MRRYFGLFFLAASLLAAVVPAISQPPATQTPKEQPSKDQSQSAQPQYDDPPLPAGKRAPQFKTTTLEGKPLTLRSLRGKVVLLDFWATWCGPCRDTVPVLQALHRQYRRQGLRVVGMSVDDASTVNQIKPFQKEMKITYPLAVNPKANPNIAHAYNAIVFPSMYLIDREGIVRWSSIGLTDVKKDTKVLTDQVNRLLVRHRRARTAKRTIHKQVSENRQ